MAIFAKCQMTNAHCPSACCQLMAGLEFVLAFHIENEFV